MPSNGRSARPVSVRSHTWDRTQCYFKAHKVEPWWSWLSTVEEERHRSRGAHTLLTPCKWCVKWGALALHWPMAATSFAIAAPADRCQPVRATPHATTRGAHATQDERSV